MSAKAILTEMIALTKLQTERVIKGDHKALQDGAYQQEALLAALRDAPIDGSPGEIRALHDELSREKAKLQSLLEAESARVDFLLRLLLGNPQEKSVGYPKSIQKRGGAAAHTLNRKK